MSHVRKPGPMLVVWKDNTAVITNDLAEADFPRVALAHPGFGIVMRNGKVPPRKEGKPNLAPRTAYGLSAVGRYLYVLDVDVWQKDWTHGAEMTDLATFLKEAGAADAINVGGGGSSALVTPGKDGGSLEHRDRHEPKFNVYRTVALNLGIVVKEVRE